MARGYRPRISFECSPTLARAFVDPSFIRVVVGPLGSGKSIWSSTVLMDIASRQPVDPRTNTRRSRFAIIRNTSPELKSTTIKTWLELWPEEYCGPVRYGAPITHHIRIPSRNGEPGLDAEFLFIPLDKPKDVAKLKSLDLTAAWVNEGSEVPEAIIKMLRGRVGRFPPRRGDFQAESACIIVDTNAPDENHWIAKFDLHERPVGYAFYRQPPAVLEVEPESGKYRSTDEAYPYTFEQHHVIHAAGRMWCVNPAAENIDHLRSGYYHQQVAGSDLEWIRRYMQAQYIFLVDGKPVIPDYHDEIHTRDELPVIDDDLELGLDIGGGTLNPAAIIGQRHPRGNWLLHDEVLAGDMGVSRFVEQLKHRLTVIAPGKGVRIAWGDPAMMKRDEVFETAVKDHLRNAGIPAHEAPSNAIGLRIEAWKRAIARNIDGKPGVLIHRRCQMLRAGLSGGWHFRKIQIPGTERYAETPSKDDYSHPCDAGGYLLLGGGEHEALTRGSNRQPQDVYVAPMDFGVFS